MKLFAIPISPSSSDGVSDGSSDRMFEQVSNARRGNWSNDGKWSVMSMDHFEHSTWPSRRHSSIACAASHLPAEDGRLGLQAPSPLDTRIGSCNRHPRTQRQAQRRQDPPSQRQSPQGHRHCSRCLACLATPCSFTLALNTLIFTDADSDHPPWSWRASCKCNHRGTIRGG